MRKKFFGLCLAAMLLLMPAGVAAAEAEGVSRSVSDDNVVVTISTDKAEYAAGEEIHYTIRVENNHELYILGATELEYKNTEGLINAGAGKLNGSIPELMSGESYELSGILKGDEKVFPVTEEPPATDPVDSVTPVAPVEKAENPSSGSNAGVPMILLGVIVLVVLGVIVFLVLKKRKGSGVGRKMMIFLLVSGLLAGSLSEAAAYAASAIKTNKTVTLRPYVEFMYGGQKVMIRAVINFGLDLEKEKFSLKEYEGAKRTTCHDPSIFKDFDGTYYIFGTHMALSTSENLKDWENKDTAYRNSFTTETRVAIRAWNKDENAGNWYDYLWAPDVIYNEVMGKYCMYLSANGDDWKSNIVLLTADAATGPYEYAGSVVYGGFDETDWTETDAPQVLGVTELPRRYTANGARNKKWGDRFPNCIDPTVFYDDDGNLWMAYGSWSGGIFILSLDKNTGLRDYSAVYETNEHSDAYFGTKIAGGKYVSGEGAYIEKIGEYYWLFISYGNLEAAGGYNVRVFRSERPNGGYKDALGNDAYSDAYIFNYNLPNKGVRLFGGYQWRTFSVGEVAQGHNSAFVDEDGKSYMIYHTRTTDGTEGHTVRVHQLFLNKEGWLIAAPYQAAGEALDPQVCTVDHIAGQYEVILHELNIHYDKLEVMLPEAIYLNKDGTVTGYYEGSWSVEEGTSYITLTLDGVTYNGVALEMKKENLLTKTMVFTAIGKENQLTIWGSKTVK